MDPGVFATQGIRNEGIKDNMPLACLKGFMEGQAPAELITRYNRAESHFGTRHITFRFSRIDYLEKTPGYGAAAGGQFPAAIAGRKHPLASLYIGQRDIRFVIVKNIRNFFC